LLGDREGYRVAYSLDGRLFAASSLLGRVRLWDAAAFREIAVLQHGGKVYGLAFSADSMRLATGCSDNTIHLWDIASRTGICELRGHTGYVHAVTFSHDGTRLASASGDQTVRIWDSVRASERARGSGAPAAQAGD
jgi:WD40 repeat protein